MLNIVPAMNDALAKAIKQAGSATQLAAALGITREAVSQWKRVPAERVIAVEQATGVSREELRPDLYPPREERDNAA